MADYQSFLQTVTQKHWKKIGLKRRAGVATPLFSIYSNNSIGVGDFEDLKQLVDWCRKTGLTVIQLLPMNDVGFDFRPYDANSSFALEPAYLSLPDLQGVSLSKHEKDLTALRQDFPAGGERVNYKVKAAKMDYLWKIYQHGVEKPKALEAFVQTQSRWLEDYMLFRAIKEETKQAGWEFWPGEWRDRDPQAIQKFKNEHRLKLAFFEWVQWQLFEQFTEAKRYAAEHDVLLMGDLPFLVSRDSADVWAHQDYFKLDLASGAPPDSYLAKGQRWGMPPYNWPKISERGYDYLIDKLKYAENFYDLYRVDHVVGAFRLWTIPLSDPLENGGLNGSFDPADENIWEEHGRRLLTVMIENTEMLPCGEDLGTIPPCCFKVLEEYAVPGMDVQRWRKHWDGDFEFMNAGEYRKNSIAVISTHDMSSLRGWWQHEAGTVDEEMFRRLCESKGVVYGEVKAKLCDLAGSQYGRLRWKKDIRSKERFLGILGKSEGDVWDLVQVFLGSFDEQEKIWKFFGLENSFDPKPSPRLVQSAITRIHETSSIFSIQLLQDWLTLGDLIQKDPWSYRINVPGTNVKANWSLVLPLSLEEMLALDLNASIKTMVQQTERYQGVREPL